MMEGSGRSDDWGREKGWARFKVRLQPPRRQRSGALVDASTRSAS
jgi:hypothetical protein